MTPPAKCHSLFYPGDFDFSGDKNEAKAVLGQTVNLPTGNGEKLIRTTSTSLFTIVFAKFANFVWVRPTTTMFLIQTVV